MSPVGGVGINLAVQDAVAAGRILPNRCSLGGYRSQVSARFSDDAGYRQSSRRQFSDSRTASLYRPALQKTRSSRGRRLPPFCSDLCNVFQFYRRFLATSWGSACYPSMHPTSLSEPRWARLLISPHKAPNEACTGHRRASHGIVVQCWGVRLSGIGPATASPM